MKKQLIPVQPSSSEKQNVTEITKKFLDGAIDKSFFIVSVIFISLSVSWLVHALIYASI